MQGGPSTVFAFSYNPFAIQLDGDKGRYIGPGQNLDRWLELSSIESPKSAGMSSLLLGSSMCRKGHDGRNSTRFPNSADH